MSIFRKGQDAEPVPYTPPPQPAPLRPRGKGRIKKGEEHLYEQPNTNKWKAAELIRKRAVRASLVGIKEYPDKIRDKNRAAYERFRINTKIPGVQPVSITSQGVNVYTEEQLNEVRQSLPNPPPTTLEEGTMRERAFALREKHVAQTEQLMLKGVTHQSLLADILQVDEFTMKALIGAVKARWELVGGPRNANMVKGEALSKLALLEHSYWSLYSHKDTTPGNKVQVLNNLITVLDRKMLIQGLSPRVLEMQAVEAPSEASIETQSTMDASMSIQKSLSDATEAAVQLIAQANGIYTQPEPMPVEDVQSVAETVFPRKR